MPSAWRHATRVPVSRSRALHLQREEVRIADETARLLKLMKVDAMSTVLMKSRRLDVEAAGPGGAQG
jgi:hypothetical protein